MLKSATSRDAFIILLSCEENDVSFSSEVVSHVKLFVFMYASNMLERAFRLARISYVSVSNRKTIHHIHRSGLFAEMLSLLCLSTISRDVMRHTHASNQQWKSKHKCPKVRHKCRLSDLWDIIGSAMYQLQIVSMVKHGRDKDEQRNHAIILLHRER